MAKLAPKLKENPKNNIVEVDISYLKFKHYVILIGLLRMNSIICPLKRTLFMCAKGKI